MATAYVTHREPEFSIHADGGDAAKFVRLPGRGDDHDTFFIRVGKCTIFIGADQARLIMSQIADAFGMTVGHESEEATIAEGDNPGD